jgi:class 3 adenylate cyclase/tetratricopeptide (TPR) repeat protein
MNESALKPDALRRAISALEAQRLTLGEQVTDVTLAALQEKLAAVLAQTAVPPPQRIAQRKQLTILFANLSGFSTVADALPDNRHPDIINLLWRRLDGAIVAHGGMVDKHIGDAVMGLFGVPIAGEDDPEKAIRAALAMRAALSGFISETHEQWAAIGHPTDVPAASELRLRIGINTGPVLLGEVGSSDEYTVIGDPVNVASRLEHAAPDGGILISQATYQLVRGLFDCEPLGPIEIKGKRDPLPVYLVLGAKPRPLHGKSRGVEGVETRMVGRDAELLALQSALEQVRQTHRGQIVTIVGEAGVGKSRLAYEFGKWAKTAVSDITILQGRTDQGMKQLPYALVRDLFVNIFAIQDSDPPAVVEEKFRQGLAELRQDEEAAEWQRQIRSLAQLVGLNLAEATALALAPSEAAQAREQVFTDVANLLQALLLRSPATLLLLEDVHWADAGSLNLIDRLAQLCLTDPLLIVCVTRPSLFEWREGWGGGTAVATPNQPTPTPIPQTMLTLGALSRADSERLVHDILRYLPEIPPDLSDLIVSRAGGNPFYVEELVKVLIEDGVIIPGEGVWRVLARHLEGVRVPPTLTGVLQARLDRLSSLERVSLQRAAVVGRIFWDTAVVLMNTLSPDSAIREPESVAALQALEKREIIFQRDASTFAGSKAYLFKHELLREVAYESVLLRTRPAYHKQVAAWLAEQSGERVGEYAGLIADHYERAEEPLAAAEMHELAAIRAQEMTDPALALHHYGRILLLLAETPSQASWLVGIQERVAQLLLMQARLVEAAERYQEMRQTAEQDGNLAAQARALNGLAGVLYEQGQYAALLETSERAEKVAWLVGEEMQLIQSLRDKAEAYHRLGDGLPALVAARQALAFSERWGEGTAVVLSVRALGALHISGGQQAYAQYYLERLQAIAHQWAEAGRDPAEVGLAYRSAAELQMQLGRFDAAGQNLLTALRWYQQAERRADIAQTLYRLGDVARLQGRGQVALPLYREAIADANARGDRYAEMSYRVDLAAALRQTGHTETAERLLARLAQYAENKAHMGSWRRLGRVYLFWAEALLAEGKATAAAQAGQQAAELAFEMADDRLRGEAWRVLGLAADQLPEGKRPLRLNDHPYTATDCFQESLRLLRRAGGNSSSAFREQALTLRAWAAHEAAHGRPTRSQIMSQEAEALAAEIGMQK